jgi:hypothetical protein
MLSLRLSIAKVRGEAANLRNNRKDKLMHTPKFGWFLIAFGALLLFMKGGFGFILLPLLFFWPLFLLPFVFMLNKRGYARHGGHGWHRHHGCGPHGPAPRDEVREREDDEPRPNTGDTIRL